MISEQQLLAHLDAQIVSARRLLGLVLEQGKSIRARDAEAVMTKLAELQAEMTRRAQLENARTALLQRAAGALGRPASQVTLEALCTLLTPSGAAAATERSAQLRGLLAEIAREHGINRALMRQELAFLSHLVRLVGGEPEAGYHPARGHTSTPGTPAQRPQALNLRA